MTIEQEEFDLQQAKEELNNIDYMFPYADPEYKEMARKAAQRRVDVLQLRVNRKKNIALNTAFQNEAMYEEDKAGKMEDFANMSPLEKAGRATASTILKIGAGAAKLPGYGMQLGGFLERWRTDDKSGNDLQTAGEGWNQAIDDFIAEGTGFDSRTLGSGNASLLKPSSWNAQDVGASAIRTIEGLQELKGGLTALGELGNAVGAGKYLSQAPAAVKTIGEGTLFGLQNIPEHSRYYEQTRGEFSPVRSVTTGLVSGQAMAWAFALGRGGLGMTESQAMNFARESVRKGTLDLTKDAFKQAARTALLNGSLNGVGASGLKEILASPENSTWEQKYEAFKRVMESAAHETMMGGIFGLQEGYNKNLSNRQTYRGMMERGKVLLGEKPAEARTFKETLKQVVKGNFKGVKETFSKIWSPEINDKAFDTGVNEYFFGKEGAKLRGNPEEAEKLFAGPKQNIDTFVEKVRENLPQDSVSLKDPGAVESALKAYKASLYIERNNTLLDRLAKDRGIDLNTIKEAYNKGNLKIKENGDVVGYLVGKIEDIKLELKNTNDTINKLDITIKSKDVDLQAKQEAAQQKEEALLRQEELYRKTETPYTRAEVIEAVRDMVARGYGNNPEMLNKATERLADFLSKYNSQEPIGVDDAIRLLNEVESELNKLNPDVKFDNYNSDIEDIINPKLIGSDVIYGNDERNMPTSALSNNTQPQSVLPSPQETPLLEYNPTGRRQMPISEGSNQPINNMDIGSKVNRESLSSFGVVNDVPRSIISSEKPNKSNMLKKPTGSADKIKPSTIRGKKLESPSVAMGKSQPSSEPMAVKKESKPETKPSADNDKSPKLKTAWNFDEDVDNSNIKSDFKLTEPSELSKKIQKLKDNTDWTRIKTEKEADDILKQIDVLQKELDSNNSPEFNVERATNSLDRLKERVEYQKKEIQYQNKKKAEKRTPWKESDELIEARKKAEFYKKAVKGNLTRITTKANGGMTVDGQFGVVDVNDLQTATSIGETQNRNRKTVASQAQVNSIANNPNPEYLIVDNPDSANGAMVIASDGTVLSGNGRTLGLSEAYKYGNADKYKAYLKEHASEFGIDPREIDKIENPVLVRIVDSKDGFDVKRFVKESNESRQLGRNAAEIARTDAENIKGILREFNSIDDITSPSNKEFIQKFFENTVGDTERANYLAEDGSLTQDGQRRIENALIASLYGNNPRLIEKLANTTNTGIKNVAKALIATAKDGAKLKGEVDKGMYFDVDLNKEISDAALTYADTVAEMHRQGVNGSPINFYLANMKDRLTPEGKLVFGMLSELNNKPKQVREFLQIINDVIRGHGDPQQGDLFAGKNPKPNKLQIIKEALQEFDSRYKTDFSKQDLSKWNKSERTLFDIGNEVREDGTPASVKKFIPDYKNKKKSSWTKEDWEDYDKDQTKIAYDILGEENTDTTPIEKTNDIKLSKQQQNMYKSLKEFLPDIFEVYDREAESPAPVQALMNILRGGESLADIETAITRGDSREAIDIIENIKQRVELTYSKDFSNKIAKNCDRLIKMIKNSNYRSNAIKPISLEELEAQPIKRMPQGDVEGWREQRKAYLEDRRTTSLSKFHKKVFANEARIVSRMYKNRQITNEQRKLFHKILKADYDYNVSVDGSNLTEKQEQIATKAIDKFNKNVNELINQLNNGKISFEDFVKERHQASIDYHTSLANDGIQSNAMRRTTIDPNRHKPQLSRIKNKATNPVTDKELNNFLRGQAKQISQETGLNFKVVDSVDELRKMFPNNDITDTVEGGIHKDTVYLVKGNIDKDRLPLVIAHEVAGHRGVESLFENKQQMDNFFNSLERAAAKDKFIRDAFAEVDRLGYKENRSREAMAKIVERVRNESGTLKGTAKTFVNFITSRVRRLLRRMGFKNLQLNEAEVYDIAVQALRRTGLKNSNKFFGLDRFFAKDNSFLSATSTELDQKYPGWQNQTNDSGGHTTQIKATVNTYRKIGEWIKNNMKGAKILDASSGLGEGTEALKQMGLNIEDVEPYASNKRKNAPIYDSYDKIKGKYDAIISNAVLNVIPDNWRSELLHNMVDKLNDGGKLFINVRDAKEVSGQKQKVELDSPSEILVTNGKGGYRAYQKGFTQPELESWVKKELGSGYKVEKANEKNSGMPSGSRAVVITKEGGNGDKRTNPRYEEITKQLNAKQLGNREFNNKATELGALKTLQGTKIERYKKTVGKEVSGQVYVHKNYANEVIPNEILDKAKKILSEKNPSFKYNTLMWDKNKGTIRFDEAPNFDTAPEPIPGKMLSVNPITGEVKEAYSSKIWHHKWQWVKDDYNGFDIKESWNRSREWLNGLANLNLEKDNPDYSIVNNGIANGKANGYEAWNKQLKYYGLDHLIDDKNNTVPKADIQFSIGERKPRKVKPDVVSEAEKKILDEIGEVKNPRDYNAVKKIAKNRMAEYKDVFSTKKNTGYKTAALKLHYLLGFDRKTQSVEKAFQSIRDFNTLQKTASAYARSIIGDKSTQASILDSIVKAKTFEKVYDIISKTNIAKEREIRKDLLDDFRNTIKELNPKKISTPTRMYTDEILGESFTPEELDSLIHSNEFTTKAVGKLRNIADNLASELGNIRKSDIEVSEYAINNAARLKHELNEIIKQRDAGNGAMNVPVEKLAEVNQLLKRFVNQDKLYKESLDTSAKNAAVADREQILSESPEKNPKTVNSRETNSIGRFKEYFLPGKALKTQDNENVAATMGKTMHKVAYEDLLEGQNRQDHYRATGYKGVDKIMESFGKDLEDGREYLDKTAFKVKTSEGHEYEITNNEALAIIANYLDRETGQMIKKAGKVNFYLGEKKDSDYFTFTRKELDDMVNKLTPKQKKAIEDGFALLSNDFLPELNRVYEKLNGVPLRLIQGRYFPRMHVDVTQSGSNGLITKDRAPYIHQQMNADYQGILKQRDAMATPNLNLRGFTDTLQNYTDQASLYIGMAEPLRHLNRIMNGQMKRELTARYGAEYVNRINQMTRLMAGMAGKTEVDKGFATRYLSNLAAAKLTPLSAIKQLTSVPLASSVIPAEYLAKASISGMSNENIKEMMELDGMVLRYRSNGIAGIIPVNAKTWGRERIQGEKFKGQKLIDKAVGVGLNLSIMADKRALGIIYKATKLWAESQGKGSDKAWIENKFMEAVRRTQNTTDLASATGWQMDSRESGTMAFLNMYLNQTQKVSNEFFRNKRLMDEAAKKYGKDSAQYKEARNRTATFAASAALMEAMMLAIGSGASMLFKGKDEDSVKDKAVTAVSDLTGNPLLKPMINAYSLQGVLKGKKPTNAAVFGDDFSGMIPEIAYTMGRVMNDLQSDDPVARKFRKLSYDMLSSKAAETSLALGRVPTWFARYPAKFIKRIWGEDLKNTRQKPSISSSSGSSRLFSGKRMFGNSRTFGGKRMF